MSAPLIGFDVEDLRSPVKDALRWIADQKRGLVELPTAQGETAPRNLTGSGRKHLSRYVEGLGLGIAALTADIPGLRLTEARSVDERIERTCEAIDLARELGVSIVTASVGALTHPESGVVSDIGAAALRRIGEFADSRGVVYALRPTQDSADRIERVGKNRMAQSRVVAGRATGAGRTRVGVRRHDTLATHGRRDGRENRSRRYARESNAATAISF